MPPRGHLPALAQAKASLHGGGGHSVKRSGSMEKLYNAAYVIYAYPDGSVEVAKNRLEDVKGKLDTDKLIPIFSRILADLKLKETEFEHWR